MDILILFKQSLPALLSGLYVTLEVAAISLVIATVLGLSFGMLAISRNKILKFVAIVYVDIFRGTPLIVQAFFIYFGLPAALDIKIPAFVAGVLCISLNAGAYMVEIFRAGIMAVDKGQMEAALSIGMTWFQGLNRIVFRQAAVFAMPLLANEFLGLIKSTSIVFTITVIELLGGAKIACAENYRYLETYLVVAVIYWMISIVFEKLFLIAEHKLAYFKKGVNI